MFQSTLSSVHKVHYQNPCFLTSYHNVILLDSSVTAPVLILHIQMFYVALYCTARAHIHWTWCGAISTVQCYA